jgi:hypothetical protein
MLSILIGRIGITSYSSYAAPSSRPSSLIITSLYLADASVGESI